MSSSESDAPAHPAAALEITEDTPGDVWLRHLRLGCCHGWVGAHVAGFEVRSIVAALARLHRARHGCPCLTAIVERYARTPAGGDA